MEDLRKVLITEYTMNGNEFRFFSGSDGSTYDNIDEAYMEMAEGEEGQETYEEERAWSVDIEDFWNLDILELLKQGKYVVTSYGEIVKVGDEGTW